MTSSTGWRSRRHGRGLCSSINSITDSCASGVRFSSITGVLGLAQGGHLMSVPLLSRSCARRRLDAPRCDRLRTSGLRVLTEEHSTALQEGCTKEKGGKNRGKSA
eukprot:scaffold45972_cov59-Phaeocystis_antarctica.AAC.5